MQNFVWTRKYILTVQYTGFGHTTRIFAQLLLGLWLRRSYALEVWGFWICLWLKQELLFCTVPLSVIFSIFPIPAHWNGSCRFASLTGVPIFSCRSSIGFWPNAILLVRKLENQATTVMDSLWSLLLVSVPVWLFPVGGSWEWNEPACPSCNHTMLELAGIADYSTSAISTNPCMKSSSLDKGLALLTDPLALSSLCPL